MTTTETVNAICYADHDDSLAAAAADYAETHGVDGWRVEASWVDPDTRIEILITVQS